MLFACCLGVMAGATCLEARAFETDQFTLPPQPLDDLGPDLAAMVRGILHAEVAELNARVSERMRDRPDGVAEAIDETEFLKRVYQKTGIGILETPIEIAIHYGDFPGRNVRFKPSLDESIYTGTFSPFVLTHLFDVPTVRLYGVDLGTDKIGHLFQEGYEYYTRYTDARKLGMDEAAAIASAIQYGVDQERGLYGVMTTGVYSNGDLAANYAGFKFYRNLFHEVRIGERTIAPIVRRDGARWIVDPDRDTADLLEPFISEHLNEAYNPSLYFFSVDLIRKHVRERCASWFSQVPDFDETTYQAHLEEVKTWFGEPYGWDLPDDRAVSLLECFRADIPSSPQDAGWRPELTAGRRP
jgi:hypothetical protein